MTVVPAILFPPPLTPGTVVGIEALIVAALMWLGTGWVRRHSKSFGRIVRPLAWLSGITGVVLVLGAVFSDTTPLSDLKNPVPNTVDSVTKGQELYLANCAACHGVDARGGGPQAGTTQIRPPDLKSGHLNQHTDGDIYYWISNGLQGGMPAWESVLSETDRWNLVNYLRSINGQGPTAPPASAGASTSPGASASP
jgi:mono/diheme cytochrome c family protein